MRSSMAIGTNELKVEEIQVAGGRIQAKYAITRSLLASKLKGEDDECRQDR